jgi:hypothetical protein
VLILPWKSHPERDNCSYNASLRTANNDLFHPPRLSQNGAANGDDHGRKGMEWFSQKTSIAGTQIPNWVIVLAVVIVLFLIYRMIT